MTPDGVMYQVIPKNCEFVPHPTLSTIENICAEVTIDVNSERRPNKYGRDLFKFIVAQNGHYTLYIAEIIQMQQQEVRQVQAIGEQMMIYVQVKEL